MDVTNPLIPHGGVVLEPLTTQRHLSSAETKPREASYKTLVISIIVTVSNQGCYSLITWELPS